MTSGTSDASPAVARSTLTLTSSDVHDGATIALVHVYNADGCTGQDMSPALAWSGAPPATKSFALTIHDPDAPHPGGWWHWVAYDIPASTSSLSRGAGTPTGMPAGTRQGRNDFGNARYDGPCPPVGDHPHHYKFVLSALNVASLGLPAGATGAQVAAAVQAHTLATGQITGLYVR